MGVKGLNKVLEEINGIKYLQKIKLKDLAGCNVAVDANNWIYQFLCAGRKAASGEILNSKGEKITILLGLYRRIIFMLKNKLKPIFVFDGVPPVFKKEVLDSRKKLKKVAQEKIDKQEYTCTEEKKKLIQKASKVTKKDITTCKKMLELMGVSYIQAPGEADAQLAYLYKKGLVDYILSEDIDIIVYGGNKIIRGFKNNKVNYNVINTDGLLTLIDQQDLGKLSILLGCDYFSGVKGIGKKKVIKMIENKEIEFDSVLDVHKDLVEKIMLHFTEPLVTETDSIKVITPNLEKLSDFVINTLEIDFSENIYKTQCCK